MRLRALVGIGVVAAAALALMLLGREDGRPPVDEPLLPDAPAPAFQVATPRPLAEEHPTARWSAVLRPWRFARARRDGRGRADARPRTPKGTQNLVLVRDRAVDHDGELWIRIAGPGARGSRRGGCPGARWANTTPSRRGSSSASSRTPRRCFAADRRRAVPRRRRGRCPADPARQLLCPQMPDPLQQRLLRPARVRHERPVAVGDRLAGRRLRRIHGTNQPELLPGTRLPRLHPAPQRRHPPARAA